MIIIFCLKLDNCLVKKVMPKRTYQPKKARRAKVHGFRAKMRTSGGRNVLKRRMARGRKRVSIQRKFK